MSGIRQALLENGYETLSLKKAKLHNEKNLIEITLESPEILSVSEINGIRDFVSKYAEGMDTSTVILFPGLYELLEESGYAEGFFRRALMGIMPLYSPVLENARIETDGTDVSVYIPDSVFGLIKNNLDVDLGSAIQSYYGVKANVSVFGDKKLKIERREIAEDPISEATPAIKPKPKNELIFGKAGKGKTQEIKNISELSRDVVIMGRILNAEEKRVKKNELSIVSGAVSDDTGSVPFKLFAKSIKEGKAIFAAIEKAKKEGDSLKIYGFVAMDKFVKDICVNANCIMIMRDQKREDTSEEKRTELHLHTQLSSLDGVTRVKDVIKTAARWGHKAVAITDHGVVQAFPEAAQTAKEEGIKAILGVEGYLVPDCDFLPFDSGFVTLKYTSHTMAKHVYPVAVEMCRIKNGMPEKSYSVPVNPGIKLPLSILDGCPYTQKELDSARPLNELIGEIRDFIGEDTVAVYQSAQMGELVSACSRFGQELSERYVDLKLLTRYLFRNEWAEQMESALKNLGFSDTQDTAENAARLLRSILDELYRRGISGIPVQLRVISPTAKPPRTNHIIILAKNQAGLVNLYRLISYSHIDYFAHQPRIPKSLLHILREGLILGTACERGELFRQIISGAEESELEKTANWYDYLEIQPLGNNRFMLRQDAEKTEQTLRDYNLKVLDIGEKTGKPVVATGDVHFLNPKDDVYRAIIMGARGFDHDEEQAPLYFRTTGEMLAEFDYLGEEKAFEVTVKNPGLIADMCDEIDPFLSGQHTYTPHIENAESDIESFSRATARRLYGDILPEQVENRLNRELNSVISNGYASLYLMAQKLVNKSKGDGYLVGSRGSVGSSLVATLSGITEVNPLPPHYRCPKCRHSEFEVTREKSDCGVDMPDKNCPVCGEKYVKDGYSIPFEVFLGFEGDKTPDIDLNFSGEYQSQAHKFTEEMFGKDYAFRAGTISTLKQKTIYGHVMAYLEAENRVVSGTERERLIAGCEGVKRTTGQHPGGIIIVPEGNDIMEFTPVQYPADNTSGDTVTTHFDFHAMDDRLVKLDILGHDDPTMLKALYDLTGIDPTSIPLDEKKTMSLFTSSDALGVDLGALYCELGTLAIPEFGTIPARRTLMATKPTTMEELVRISGLTHGTGVWKGNAEDLIADGVATLFDVICARDDIMNYLMLHGIPPKIAFNIMERVRKGKGLTQEMEAEMRQHDVPEWYIGSCNTIEYMFPRAHAAAYVMMAFRVAYYKVYHPLAFYSVYYTVRADVFDIAYAQGGANKVRSNLYELYRTVREDESKKDLITILEVVYEMNLRGIELLPLDIYKSHATKFLIEGEAIRPPFSSLSGVGVNAAENLEKGRMGGEYISIEDFIARTKVNSAALKLLKEQGCLDGLPEKNQMSIF